MAVDRAAFRRRWHATLRQLVADGHLPRPLTDEERRCAQLVIFESLSLSDALDARLEAVARRLSRARPQDLAWALWLHGVLVPGGGWGAGSPDRAHDVEERLAIKIHMGGMSEQEARRTLIIETA